MAINYYHATNGDGLFQILGKLFNVADTVNIARRTTIPADVDEALAQFRKVTQPSLDLVRALDNLATATEQSKAVWSGFLSELRARAEEYLITVVDEAYPLPSEDLETALQELITRMLADAYYVTPNGVTFSLATTAANIGDVALAYTALRGDGKVQENTLTDTLAIKITDATTDISPTLEVKGLVGVSDRLSEAWPLGAGTDTQLSAVDPSSTLLANGDFEDETITDTPDGWIAYVGTPGTTIQVSNPEIQTVAITGTPTAGSYLLTWTNPEGIARSTTELAYDAAASTVEAALRLLPGLEAVTASSTGTSPNYTHTITFVGVAKNVAVLASVSHLNTGSITHATTQQGDDGAFRGKALLFQSDGSTLNAVYAPLDLAAETVYFCHARIKRHEVATAGVIKLEIVDGIGGNVTTDGAGNSNALTINVVDLPTGEHSSQWFAFRIKPTIAQPVYLRIRISTAITNKVGIFFDDVCVVTGEQLYEGGPWVKAFGGRKVPAVGDSWILTVTNTRAGTIQEWFNRFFGMADLELLLPSSGTTLIPAATLTDEESSSSTSSSSLSSSQSSSSSSSPSSSSTSSSSTSSSSSSSSNSSSSSSS